MGDRGESDARGPWNEGGDWQMVEAPAFRELETVVAGSREPGENGSSRKK
jgi:Mn-containing catalase